MQGLVAAGRNPGLFRPKGTSPYDYLKRRQRSDGHYEYSSSSDQTPVWVTAQGLAAASGIEFPIAAVERAPKPPKKDDSSSSGDSGSTGSGGYDYSGGGSATTAARPATALRQRRRRIRRRLGGYGSGGGLGSPGSGSGGARQRRRRRRGAGRSPRVDGGRPRAAPSGSGSR